MTSLEVLRLYHNLINSLNYKDIITKPEDTLIDFSIKPSELNNKVIQFCENSFISSPKQEEINNIHDLIILFMFELEFYFTVTE